MRSIGYGEGLYPRKLMFVAGAVPLTRPASRSLSSGAHSRDPVASPDDLSPQKSGER
jgi:hypothetical protein